LAGRDCPAVERKPVSDHHGAVRSPGTVLNILAQRSDRPNPRVM
jgi:hypothetical protein